MPRLPARSMPRSSRRSPPRPSPRSPLRPSPFPSSPRSPSTTAASAAASFVASAAASVAAASAAALALAACSAPAAPPASPTAAASPPPALHRAFVLHFEGARIGYALEDERVTPDQRRQLARRELVRIRRGSRITSVETSLLIRGAAAGEADELDVSVRHCEADSLAALPAPSLTAPLALACPQGADVGAFTARATARRTAGAWQVESTLAATTRALPFAAQPAEWLDTRPDGEPRELRDQLVFFATRAFSLGRADRHWLDERTWIGSVSLGGEVLSSTTTLDDDRRPRLILDEQGGTATRIAEAMIAFETLELADLVALTAIDVRGRPPAPGAPRRLSLSLETDQATSPPAEAPGQLVTGAPPSLHLELVPQPARPDDAAAVAAIAELARQVLPGHRGGDCTAYALRYAAAAARRDIPTRLVTGFALDESETAAAASGVLVRHRWAVSWTGARWISVDPSAPAGEVAPARPRLFALAIHDATPEALAAAESAFTGWRGVDARWEK